MLLFIASMLAAAPVTAPPCSTDYWPLAPGTEWEYRLEIRFPAAGSNLSGTSRVTVSGTLETSVVVSSELHASRGGGPAETSSSALSYLCTAEGPVAMRPWMPSGPVTSWGSETPRGLAPGHRWATWVEIWMPRKRVVTKTSLTATATEPVAVPAGAYDALRVDFDRLDGDEPDFGMRVRSRGTHWYARGVGLVKMRAETVATIAGREQAPSTVEQELIRFRPGPAETPAVP